MVIARALARPTVSDLAASKAGERLALPCKGY
jgi:hypothetical protein